MTDIDEATSFSQSTPQTRGSEEFLPLTNHILDNDTTRSDTKGVECNRHSTPSRDFRNHTPSDNRGALTQGNNVMLFL